MMKMMMVLVMRMMVMIVRVVMAIVMVEVDFSEKGAMWMDPVLLPPLGWNSNWRSSTNVNNGGERFLVTQCTLLPGCDREGGEDQLTC